MSNTVRMEDYALDSCCLKLSITCSNATRSTFMCLVRTTADVIVSMRRAKLQQLNLFLGL